MCTRQLVLTPPKSSHPGPSLSCQQSASISPLAATLMDIPASVANKGFTRSLSPLAATLTKNRGVGGVMVNQLPPVKIAVLSFHPLMNCPLFPREKQSLSFHTLTNCPFSISFILTFMHRMGGVGGTTNIQTFKPANIPTLPGSSSHAGRIANTIRSRRRNDAKKSSNCFHGQYFLFSNCIPRSASAPVTISARASAQSPSGFPLAVHGAIRARGLFRMRFPFPETPIVYAYSFALLESSLAEGSAANHTGVFTPSPLFLKVSRFKYLCFANVSNPIASPPAIPWMAFYARHKKVGQTFLSVPGVLIRRLCGQQTQRAPRFNRSALGATSKKFLTSFARTSHAP